MFVFFKNGIITEDRHYYQFIFIGQSRVGYIGIVNRTYLLKGGLIMGIFNRKEKQTLSEKRDAVLKDDSESGLTSYLL